MKLGPWTLTVAVAMALSIVSSSAAQTPIEDALLPRELTTKVSPPPKRVVQATTELDWLQKLDMPDFPVRLTEPVVAQLERIKGPGWWHGLMGRWMARKTRYSKMILRVLREEEVPEDLLYVAMIESSFNPRAKSRAGATGLWQFMPAAGAEGGLERNRWLDERMDPERSTRAAARTLRWLHRRLGSWELAFAAYNMGFYGLRSVVRTYNTNDYWSLRSYEYALPSETRNYVPRILAAAIVGRNLELFGYSDIEFDEAVPCEPLEIPRPMGLGRLARLCGSRRSVLRDLNPQLRRSRTPGGGEPYRLCVPPGTADRAAARLRRLSGRATKLARHAVRVGEDLEAVAEEHGVSRSRLARLNEMSPRASLRPGMVLVVPEHDEEDDEAEAEEEGEEVTAIVPPRRFVYGDRRRVFYRTVSGDSVARLASAFHVTPAEIVMWNGLDPAATLQTDMVLQIFPPLDHRLAEVRHLTEEQVRVFVAGSRELFEEMAERRERRRIVYRARRGDTLERISRRFGLGVGSIRRINHFDRRHRPEPGDEIVLYVEPRRLPRRYRRRLAQREQSSSSAARAADTSSLSEPDQEATEEPAEAEAEPAEAEAEPAEAEAEPAEAEAEPVEAEAEPAEAPADAGAAAEPDAGAADEPDADAS